MCSDSASGAELFEGSGGVSEIKRFEKEAGSGVLVSMDEEEPIMIIGDTLPEWVRLPPELGGAKKTVLSGFMAPCPRCGVGGRVKHMRLEGDLYVAECKNGCGFVWYNRKAE